MGRRTALAVEHGEDDVVEAALDTGELGGEHRGGHGGIVPEDAAAPAEDRDGWRVDAPVAVAQVALAPVEVGQILVPALRTPPIPGAVRDALTTIPAGGEPGDPDIDQDWGEPGLTAAERVIAGTTLEVLSLATGNPDVPVNAIPGSAHAHCQLRFVVGTDITGMTAALRAHLDEHGFSMVTVEAGHVMNASRTDPANPWVQFALASMERTEGTRPVLLPNLGGSLPNDVFTDQLALPIHSPG
jgi:acetylornithine deacetylase/succinyl-diaminopimelate desuccinylase-like protein